MYLTLLSHLWKNIFFSEKRRTINERKEATRRMNKIKRQHDGEFYTFFSLMNLYLIGFNLQPSNVPKWSIVFPIVGVILSASTIFLKKKILLLTSGSLITLIAYLYIIKVTASELMVRIGALGESLFVLILLLSNLFESGFLKIDQSIK